MARTGLLTERGIRNTWKPDSYEIFTRCWGLSSVSVFFFHVVKTLFIIIRRQKICGINIYYPEILKKWINSSLKLQTIISPTTTLLCFLRLMTHNHTSQYNCYPVDYIPPYTTLLFWNVFTLHFSHNIRRKIFVKCLVVSVS